MLAVIGSAHVIRVMLTQASWSVCLDMYRGINSPVSDSCIGIDKPSYSNVLHIFHCQSLGVTVVTIIDGIKS